MLINSRQVILKCLGLCFRPVATFCLKHSIDFQELLEVIKSTLVEQAAQTLEEDGEKVNSSRLSILTGLHRREVQRIYKGEQKQAHLSHTMRVIGQWQGDPDFTTKAGKPKVLRHEGDHSEFADLVRKVCTDLHPGTVLFELERLGIVERDGAKLHLLNQAFMPKDDPEEIYKLYATDATHLLHAVDENIFADDPQRNLHIRTEYDNVELDAVPEIRTWLYREGNLLHQKAMNYISKFDLDLNPNPKKKGGARIVLGSFSRALKVSKNKTGDSNY